MYVPFHAARAVAAWNVGAVIFRGSQQFGLHALVLKQRAKEARLLAERVIDETAK